MKLRSLLHLLLLLGFFASSLPLLAYDPVPLQLGSVGGTFRMNYGSGSFALRVVTVTPGGPGAAAGLQAGDIIYGAFGENFSVMPDGAEYTGAVKEYADAIERAEAGNVPLPLKVVRPGVGGLTVSVTLPNVGAFGAAYPLGSPKFDALYETACVQMHALVTNSGSSFGYQDGWIGLCLLSHTNWNDTTGPKPFRNAINIIRDWSVDRLTNAIVEPLEENQPGFVGSGLENWALTMSAMFLAEYRLKSGDTSVDATIQRAALLLANRIQYWEQPDLGNGWHPNSPGIMGHGGVVGDYIHTGFFAGINIINTHANMAMGLLKLAGADFNAPSGTNAGTLPHQSLTLEQRLRLSWEWQKTCTYPEGYVDYAVLGAGGWDASGRTAGAVAAFNLVNPAPTADDTAKYNQWRAYLPQAVGQKPQPAVPRDIHPTDERPPRPNPASFNGTWTSVFRTIRPWRQAWAPPGWTAAYRSWFVRRPVRSCHRQASWSPRSCHRGPSVGQ